MTEVVGIALNISGAPEISSPCDQHFCILTRNIIIAIICLLGLVGNGRTIYLLANSIKRNSFTTYILNLSIADSGVLISLFISTICETVYTLCKMPIFRAISFFFFHFFFFHYSASQFLLTAISLDRCVAVLFPLWHRFHRLPYLPALLCGIIWGLSFLLSAVHLISDMFRFVGDSSLVYELPVKGLLCILLMVVSTVTLLIFVSLKSRHNQRKLLTTILLALLFFLLFSFPMDIFCVIALFRVIDYSDPSHYILMTVGIGCVALSSSINPLLYFLVGRKQPGKGQPRATLKAALQRVFRDDQGNLEGQDTVEKGQL